MNAPARPRKPAEAPARPLRAAIYCRKSTTKGLEQEFSSLDAQREACERYVAAQQHLSWVALPDRYDDGGFTGANLDRPAFQQLMADIAAGGVDIVVVYKVDRLSRSLLDFAQLIAHFEAQGVAFVSVTQSFNTADAMGRLTLNILLSFAQFEREMIAERTKDKIVAARRRGKWTGGPVPLGYVSEGKKLVVHEAEAVVVRRAFALYLEHRSTTVAAAELQAAGHRSRGGVPLARNGVLTLLRNSLYTGRMRVGDELVPAEHEALVSVADFDRVQALLDGRGRGGQPGRNPVYLLAGLVTCSRCGGAYTPASTRKTGQEYRYYRCVTRDRHGPGACEARPVSAPVVEDFVVAQLQGLAADPALVAEVTAALQARVAEEVAQLRAEQRLLPGHVGQLSEDARRLVDALTATEGPAREDVQRRLSEVGSLRQDKEQRLVAVERRLLALEAVQVEVAWVAEALAHFDGVWALMTEVSRGRFVRALVQRVEVDEPTGDVAVVLTEVGAGLQEGT